jgi:hypothetical protein
VGRSSAGFAASSGLRPRASSGPKSGAYRPEWWPTVGSSSSSSTFLRNVTAWFPWSSSSGPWWRSVCQRPTKRWHSTGGNTTRSECAAWGTKTPASFMPLPPPSSAATTSSSSTMAPSRSTPTRVRSTSSSRSTPTSSVWTAPPPGPPI